MLAEEPSSAGAEPTVDVAVSARGVVVTGGVVVEVLVVEVVLVVDVVSGTTSDATVETVEAFS